MIKPTMDYGRVPLDNGDEIAYDVVQWLFESLVAIKNGTKIKPFNFDDGRFRFELKPKSSSPKGLLKAATTVLVKLVGPTRQKKLLADLCDEFNLKQFVLSRYECSANERKLVQGRK